MDTEKMAREWLEEEFGVPDCSCGEPGCPGETREEKARSLAALITQERAKAVRDAVRRCEALEREVERLTKERITDLVEERKRLVGVLRCASEILHDMTDDEAVQCAAKCREVLAAIREGGVS